MNRLRKICLSLLPAAALAADGISLPFPSSAETALRDSGISYAESTETLQNPGMGYTTTLWYRCAPGSTPVQNPAGSLVLMFVDIGAFSSGENGTKNEDGTVTGGTDYLLDNSFFAGLRGTLENCRNNGSTVALRFRYDDDGTRDPEPADFDMLKTHIRQIGEDGFLRDYQDILMFVESGFVGCYGEQWGGKYCSTEQKAELLDLLLDIVPDPIPVTVRTPNTFAAWAKIRQSELADWHSEANSRAARVGLYDDGYMGSDSDLGTYANREAETAWLGRQAETSYYGGEFSGNLEFAQKYETYLPQNAIPEMYRTHLSYINSNIWKLYQEYTFDADYDVPAADNSAYYGQNVQKFIRDHLGYRFVIRNCAMSPEAAQGGEMQLHFAVENTGFANPVREQQAELLLEKDGSYLRTALPLDSRTWRSCTVTDIEQTIQLPGSLEPGKWNVYLKLSVGENPIRQLSCRSVRFANPDIWNAALGANCLGSVQITEADSDAQRAVLRFGQSGDDTRYTVNGLHITDGVISNDGETDTPAAHTDSGTLYLHNDEQYLYLTALFDAKADAPVHNIQLKNETTGESYWLYYASNGFVYFNHGTPAGCLHQHSDGTAEFRIPFGEVMGLDLGVKLSNIRYFMQDSANDWKLLSDVTAKDYTLDGDFTVYIAPRSVTLRHGDSLSLSVITDAAEPAAVRWMKDGAVISGAVGTAFTVRADGNASGVYSAEITSAAGTVKRAEICTVKEIDAPSPSGDLNLDGKTDEADAALLTDYLLTKTDMLPAWQNADLDRSGSLTAADLAAIRRKAGSGK